MGSVKGHGVDPLGVTEASMAPSAAWRKSAHRSTEETIETYRDRYMCLNICIHMYVYIYVWYCIYIYICICMYVWYMYINIYDIVYIHTTLRYTLKCIGVRLHRFSCSFENDHLSQTPCWSRAASIFGNNVSRFSHYLPARLSYISSWKVEILHEVIMKSSIPWIKLPIGSYWPCHFHPGLQSMDFSDLDRPRRQRFNTPSGGSHAWNGEHFEHCYHFLGEYSSYYRKNMSGEWHCEKKK